MWAPFAAGGPERRLQKGTSLGEDEGVGERAGRARPTGEARSEAVLGLTCLPAWPARLCACAATPAACLPVGCLCLFRYLSRPVSR